MARKRHMQPLCYNTTPAHRARLMAWVTASLLASGALVLYITRAPMRLRHGSLHGTRALDMQTCAEYATLVQPAPEELTGLLGYQHRELSGIASTIPPLATSNWEGVVNQQHAGNRSSSCRCNSSTGAAVSVSSTAQLIWKKNIEIIHSSICTHAALPW